MDWPTIREPCSLDAGNGMAEIVVVVNSMTIAEVPLEWFGVLKGGGSLRVSIPPDTSDFIPTHCAERSSCSHDLHHIVWLFHAPNGVFYIVEDARDGVNRANNLLPKIIEHMFAKDKVGQYLCFLMREAAKTPLCLRATIAFNTQKPLSNTTYRPV